MRTSSISVERKALFATAFSMAFVSLSCSADQWPAHPMPTKLSEVAAHSALIKIRPSFKQCLGDAGGSTPPTKDCMDDEYDYQDGRLNLVYKQLMVSLSKDGQAKLREEERRWIRFRDGYCNKEEAELASYGCEIEMAADRATQLEDRLKSR
ncbi:lysozyme inhibitor LprI family protein [Dyella subtropica]|uniref:lysozyme inhibitor LprI family protein n=1 Tax=Dyella subtropica TaxID=2992127 RepID=UPI00225666F5|nr:lysozyme inhibitor LprI family protein [Dyella subtropica]